MDRQLQSIIIEVVLLAESYLLENMVLPLLKHLIASFYTIMYWEHLES
jgi:hypothetical protein